MPEALAQKIRIAEFEDIAKRLVQAAKDRGLEITILNGDVSVTPQPTNKEETNV